MYINFKPIPKTKLEIAASGSGNNKIIYFREVGKTDPMSVADTARILFIGSPESEIRAAMKDGRLSRAIASELIGGIGGNSYQKLRTYLDNVIPPF